MNSRVLLATSFIMESWLEKHKNSTRRLREYLILWVCQTEKHFKIRKSNNYTQCIFVISMYRLFLPHTECHEFFFHFGFIMSVLHMFGLWSISYLLLGYMVCVSNLVWARIFCCYSLSTSQLWCNIYAFRRLHSKPLSLMSKGIPMIQD